MVRLKRMPETSWWTERNWAPHPAKALLRNHQRQSIIWDCEGGFYVRNRLSIRFLVLAVSALFVLTATMITLVAQQGQGNAPAAPAAGGGAGRGRGAPNPLLSQPAPRLPDGTV